MTHEIEITCASPLWERQNTDYEALAGRVARAVSEVLPEAPGGTIVLLLADNARMRDLNRAFRGKDRPTNVLSFPAPATPCPPGERTALGDIALGFETVAAEADEAGKCFERHVSHLLVHGILHLLGYDHEEQAAAEEMEALEVRILATLGIPDPYAPEKGPEGSSARPVMERENG